MVLNKERFEEAYHKLVDKAHKNGDDNPSFKTGYWEKQEGYKYGFWEDARGKMEIDTWPSNKSNILGLASQPFGIITRGEEKLQNLVSPQNYNKVMLHVYTGSPKICDDATDTLYELYYGSDDKKSFEQFVKLIRGIPDPISVVSMYFFLKEKIDDDFQYVIARKEGTSRRLGMLGLHTSCLQKCTWDGYQEYLDLIRQIQDYLRPYHPDATMLDAQSFLWMMQLIEK